MLAARALRAIAGHAGRGLGARQATSTAAPDKVRAGFDHCVSQLREHDYENFLWVMQLPRVREGGEGV